MGIQKAQVALGVVVDNKKVLIIQRKKIEKGKNDVVLTWVYPGGTFKKSETRERAVEREVFEETGYRVKAGKVISEKRHPEFPVCIYYIECFIKTGEKRGKFRDDVSQIKWVSPREIPNYFTTNIDRKVLKYLGAI